MLDETKKHTVNEAITACNNAIHANVLHQSVSLLSVFFYVGSFAQTVNCDFVCVCVSEHCK